MKVVILAGGLGTRLAEEPEVKPKPMVEVGGRPILWHIMKHYAHHGFNEFYLALGYKGEAIKRYFLDYSALSGDLTVRPDAPRRLSCEKRTLGCCDELPSILATACTATRNIFVGRWPGQSASPRGGSAGYLTARFADQLALRRRTGGIRSACQAFRQYVEQNRYSPSPRTWEGSRRSSQT